MSSTLDSEHVPYIPGPPPYSREPPNAGLEAAQTGCNDPDHAKVFQMLMKLFHFSDTQFQWMESLDEWNRDVIEGALWALDELATRIKEICLVAKQSDPSLEMEEGSEPDHDSLDGLVF